VITGHSLGAGVAAVLALLMHDDSKYCGLQCFAFSPPGGLMRSVSFNLCTMPSFSAKWWLICFTVLTIFYSS